MGTQPQEGEERGLAGEQKTHAETRKNIHLTHHGNVGLGSVLEPGEELSRSVGQLLVRLSLVPERVKVGVVFFLHGVERDGGILLLQLAHASGGGGEEEGVFGRWGMLGKRAIWRVFGL